MNDIMKELLGQISDITAFPLNSAYNLRADAEGAGRRTTENIDIITKLDKPGIDIMVKPGTKNETVYIPAVITHAGVQDLVYNDFYIGEGADVTIVAGCGVHNDGCDASEHNGIHRFFLGKNSRVFYLEKHVGTGEGTGHRNINPVTHVEMEADSYMEMETTQIRGVDSTVRSTTSVLKEGAHLIIHEKLMTHGDQYAETNFEVEMIGEGSSAHVVSRSVARDNSYQKFLARIDGNSRCVGHSECDAIIMDQARVCAIPEINANCVDAELIHEAAIGKIAGEQLVKLMTLGLTETEAEEQIVAGFLK